jgi:hypothetical protein
MFKADLVIATMPINKRHIVPILYKRQPNEQNPTRTSILERR